jgi:thioredoxin-related protein
MKRILALLTVIISIHAFANDTTKLYNPIANVAKDVVEAVKKAKQENKQVLIQVGGNWCIWCYRFNDFVDC